MNILIASILAILLFVIGTVIAYANANHPAFADNENKTKTKTDEKKDIIPFP